MRDRINNRRMGRRWTGSVLTLGLVLLGVWWLIRDKPSGGSARTDAVVLYCAQDQVYAEPILADFYRETGIRVQAVYDSEAVKTVGLANRLLSERTYPICDVFWGNEELRTRQLASRGIFGDNQLSGAGGAGWVAFGQRSRRLVIDPNRLNPAEAPKSLIELTNARWAGQISLAMPLFGTTATHFLALRAEWGPEVWENWCRALMRNRPFIEEGNAHVVRRVGRGEALVGFTDSDDIDAGRREGFALEALDLKQDMLLIPNTLGAVRPMQPGGPADLLIQYLRQPEVLERLVRVGGLEAEGLDTTRSTPPPEASGLSGINGPEQRTEPMWLKPDWERVLSELDEGTQAIQEIFRQ